ncbi:DUF4279 domain-containing protein [Brevundimonas lenta]|uniref:DUF4279 domain-containing protein n=1 Tax=Brevundimonas lenta TaxID=424796 RepID=A0A7W6NP88_9CAUL|nr:DUF4279 domain-containing protein [Brevundimonas lenta]MBB4081905.1 hypothetical protein [Brevundimonas lenta]
MGTLESSAASIGFYGDDLDPAEITRSLGGEPTVGVARGETWTNDYGREITAKTGSWRLVADRQEPADLDWKIRQLFSGLNDDLQAWRSLAGRYRGRVFCGLFLATSNDGLTLQPETLRMIGERGLVVDLDIYGPIKPD